MDMRDKLTLVHPPSTVNTARSVITPSALTVERSLRDFTAGPTVSPASRVATNTPMAQHQVSETSNHFANQDDTRDKAALSFILLSSDSESDTDEANGRNCAFTSAVKRMPLTSDVSVLVRKGSKFCTVEGCTSRAKHVKRCWKHGGWVRCKIPDCSNRAKSKGVCWSHGGGTVCSFQNCDTIAVSNGFCWAHGGGKRCQVPNCSKPAYERTQNYCQTHYEELCATGTGAI